MARDCFLGVHAWVSSGATQLIDYIFITIHWVEDRLLTAYRWLCIFTPSMEFITNLWKQLLSKASVPDSVVSCFSGWFRNSIKNRCDDLKVMNTYAIHLLISMWWMWEARSIFARIAVLLSVKVPGQLIQLLCVIEGLDYLTCTPVLLDGASVTIEAFAPSILEADVCDSIAAANAND